MTKITFIIVVYIICSLKFVAARKPTIIIIGAGPAGIAAATRLLENNITNIKILEAESRIGGRIHTVQFGSAFVDLGARWCHGEKKNIVYETVKDLNLLDHTNTSMKICSSSREYIDDIFSDELLNLITSTYLLAGEDGRHKSAGEYLMEIYNRTIYERYGGDEEKLAIAITAVDLLEVYVSGLDGAFSWFDVSSRSDYLECDGDNHLNWKGKGYKTFLDVLMKKYPDPEKQLPIDKIILLNKEVENISWNVRTTHNNVNIFCYDRSSYTSDHLIFTPSIGVLKEKASDMFSPRLPIKKLQAINNIGFGSVMKVMAEFSDRWWTNSGFLSLWTDEDIKAALREFPKGPSFKGRSWVTYMNVIFPADNNPKVLSLWFRGPLVPAIEVLPKELILEGVFYSLKKVQGHTLNVSRPIKILSSNWYSNPHFRGVYSFQTVNSHRNSEEPSAEEDLAEPIENFAGRPIVQFAGEGTHPHYYSTVHGAVETGYREADRIIDLYK